MRRRGQTMEERFLAAGAVHPEAQRRERPFLTMVARGLARLALVLAVAAGLVTALGLAIGALRGDDLWTAVTYAFYLAGVGLFAFTLLTGGRRVHHRGEHGESLGTGGGTINESALLVFVALVLLGIGVLLESLRG